MRFVTQAWKSFLNFCTSFKMLDFTWFYALCILFYNLTLLLLVGSWVRVSVGSVTFWILQSEWLVLLVTQSPLLPPISVWWRPPPPYWLAAWGHHSAPHLTDYSFYSEKARGDICARAHSHTPARCARLSVGPDSCSCCRLCFPSLIHRSAVFTPTPKILVKTWNTMWYKQKHCSVIYVFPGNTFTFVLLLTNLMQRPTKSQVNFICTAPKLSWHFK